MGAESLDLLHVLHHHVEPGLDVLHAAELRRDVVLCLPAEGGSTGEGVTTSQGQAETCIPGLYLLQVSTGT